MRSGSGRRIAAMMPSTRLRRSPASSSVWMRSTSSIWSPIVSTGFSAVIGSWKTMPMRSPRSARSRCGLAASDVLALQQDLPRDRAQQLRQQPHDREGGDGFAGARLADDADDLAGADAERDVLDRMGAVAAAGQADAQAADLEDGRGSFGHRPAILGSSVSRRPSPSMFTASTVRPRKMPG